jgi:hypothetical protein
VQKLKYAEELVGVLYIKPHTIIVNKEYDLTLGARVRRRQEAMFSRSRRTKIGLLARSLVTLRV